jgi:kanamycin kinase
MKSSSPAAALRLPPQVRAAAIAALGGSRVGSELAWLSWNGTVWRLTGESGAVFVKRAADLKAERDRLAWLALRWPVPEMVGFFDAAGDDWLLTRGLPGTSLHESSVDGGPAGKAKLLGEILRRLHAVDAAGCPFGQRKPGNVLIHGDYCLPNVLVLERKLSGLVDVGRAGLGPPDVDLAAGVWSLQYNFGKGFARDFLAAYGWPPMTDEAVERLRRKYGR